MLALASCISSTGRWWAIDSRAELAAASLLLGQRQLNALCPSRVLLMMPGPTTGLTFLAICFRSTLCRVTAAAVWPVIGHLC